MAPIVRTTTTIKLPLIFQKKYAHPRLTGIKSVSLKNSPPSFIVSSSSLNQQFSTLDLLISMGAFLRDALVYTTLPRRQTQESTISSGTGHSEIPSRFTCRRATPELEAYGTFGRMKKIKVRSIRTLSPDELQAGFLHFAATLSR